MPGLTPPNLQIYRAAQFIESVSEETANNLYLSIGRTQAWANDAAPPTYHSAEFYYKDVWDNMIGAKKITGSDLRHVIYRNDWAANTVYDQWDNSKTNNLGKANVNFYVLTSNWDVYKCLFNNNSANSEIEPSVVSTSVIETADGYIWKYMYSISVADRTKFTTDTYIPVQTLSSDNNTDQWDVQEAAIPGAINVIQVTNGGSGYSNANTVSVSIVGDGVGAFANVTTNATTNVIETIYLTAYGSGYSNARVTITDTSGSGNGATANVLLAPYGGHGSDPVYELGGNKVMISVRMEAAQYPILSTNNSFRQIAIIKDPYRYGTSNGESNFVVSQMGVVTLTGAVFDYLVGEYVYQGGSTGAATFIGLVNEWDSGNSKLQLTNINGIPITDTIIGANSSTTSFLTSYQNPELIKQSGKILFINNMTEVERTADQTEEIHLTMEF